MPMAAPKPCTQARCTEYATKKSRCDKHQIKHTWVHAKSRHERGYGNDWVKIRSQALKRDNYLCQTCKRKGIFTRATEVDHIKNKAIGGDNSIDNLEGICNPCHKKKTAQEGSGEGEV